MVHDKVFAGGIHGELGVKVGVANVVYAKTVGQLLQLAVAAHLTIHAEVVALGEEEFEGSLAQGVELGCVEFHLHAVGGGHGAGGVYPPSDFDDAHPADADVGEAIEVAEGGNVNAVFLTDLEDGVSPLPLDLLPVDGELDFLGHGLSSFLP